MPDSTASEEIVSCEHDMLSTEVASDFEDGDAAEVDDTFGVTRFESDARHYDGEPPADHQAATIDVYEKYTQDFREDPQTGLFWDLDSARIFLRDDSFPTTIDGQTIEYETAPDDPTAAMTTVFVPSAKLEYHAPEGTIEVDLGLSDITVRANPHEGETPPVRYYVSSHMRPEDGSTYTVLRRDTRDPLQYMPPPVEGMSMADKTVNRFFVERDRLLAIRAEQEAGIYDPLASPEEVAYVFNEVLENARPVEKSYEDVARIVDDIMRNPPEITGHDYAEANRLYDALVTTYRAALMTPEDVISGATETDHLVWDSPDSNTDNSTFLHEKSSQPIISLWHRQRLSAEETSAMMGDNARFEGRRGIHTTITLIYNGSSGLEWTRSTYMAFGNNKDMKQTHFRLDKHDRGRPTLELIRALRAYLWKDMQ